MCVVGACKSLHTPGISVLQVGLGTARRGGRKQKRGLRDHLLYSRGEFWIVPQEYASDCRPGNQRQIQSNGTSGDAVGPLDDQRITRLYLSEDPGKNQDQSKV